jgi:Sulfotransferase domain
MKPADFTRKVRPVTIANKDYNKVFCIGYNKTGTSTLETVLRLYGLQMPDQHEQEIRLTRQVFQRNYHPFIEFVSRFDAFQDLPFSQDDTFIAADALFPNSKFILTEREPDQWFDSLTRFHQKVFEVDDLQKITRENFSAKLDRLYPGYRRFNKARFLTRFEGTKPIERWDLLYNRDYYVQEYMARNERIKKYFLHCPERLLIIDVTREKETRTICNFLNIPAEYTVQMPHINRT